MLRGTLDSGARTGERPLEGAVLEGCLPAAAPVAPVTEMFAVVVVVMRDVLASGSVDSNQRPTGCSRKEMPTSS